MVRGWWLYTFVKNGRCRLQQMINNRLDLPKIAVLDLHKVQEKIITNRDASDGHCNARSSASSSTICRLNNFLLLVLPTLPNLELIKIGTQVHDFQLKMGAGQFLDYSPPSSFGKVGNTVNDASCFHNTIHKSGSALAMGSRL